MSFLLKQTFFDKQEAEARLALIMPRRENVCCEGMNDYEYDGLHRLIDSYGYGAAGSYSTNHSYSPSGRLIEKYRNNSSATLSASAYMVYGYCDDYQPHAVKRMFDYNSGLLYDLRWDGAGNLGQVSMAMPGEMVEASRFLFWTEDSAVQSERRTNSFVFPSQNSVGVANWMHTAVDDRCYSYYTYDHSGERRLKLTGANDLLDVNADYMFTISLLDRPTLYPSAYMVLTNRGYTNVAKAESRASLLALPRRSSVTERKHYYAGAERVAARLGGGGLNAINQTIGNDDALLATSSVSASTRTSSRVCCHQSYSMVAL